MVRSAVHAVVLFLPLLKLQGCGSPTQNPEKLCRKLCSNPEYFGSLGPNELWLETDELCVKEQSKDKEDKEDRLYPSRSTQALCRKCTELNDRGTSATSFTKCIMAESCHVGEKRCAKVDKRYQKLREKMTGAAWWTPDQKLREKMKIDKKKRMEKEKADKEKDEKEETKKEQAKQEKKETKREQEKQVANFKKSQKTMKQRQEELKRRHSEKQAEEQLGKAYSNGDLQTTARTHRGTGDEDFPDEPPRAPVGFPRLKSAQGSFAEFSPLDELHNKLQEQVQQMVSTYAKIERLQQHLAATG